MNESMESRSTLYVPRLQLVEINVADDVQFDLLRRHLLPQVVAEQLFLGGMKAEARRHTGPPIHRHAHSRVVEKKKKANVLIYLSIESHRSALRRGPMISIGLLVASGVSYAGLEESHPPHGRNVERERERGQHA